MTDFRERKAARAKHYAQNVYGWKLQTCSACSGSGRYDTNGSPRCSACNGTGKERVPPAKSDTAQRTLSRPSDGKGDEAMTDDNLPPPLPQPEFDKLLDHIYEYGTLAEGIIQRARAMCEAYARSTILVERERCALVCEEKHVNGNWKHDTRHECATAIREGN